MKKLFVLAISHTVVLVAGFVLGVYFLPILTAPEAPSATAVAQVAGTAEYRGTFHRDLAGSDLLHWGEGEVTVGREAVTLTGEIAPGPDYKLYLSPEFVQTEAEFLPLKSRMVRVGDVRTFENFIVQVPEGVNPADYTTVVVWCESFGEFITAARYR